MPQSQFTYRQGLSQELDLFPQIKEFGLRKNNTIQLDSFPLAKSDDLQVYFVVDGRFEWMVNRRSYVLYPGDTVLVLPGQEIGAAKGHLEIGTLFFLHLAVDGIAPDGSLALGKWSNLSAVERLTISKILRLNTLPVMKVKDVTCILQDIRSELTNQEIGFGTRVNYLIDSLLIILGRQSTRQASSHRDFPKTFTKLEQTLRKNLAHQWTVEDMAAMVGLGTTAFTEKVKNYTGFAPLHYLINIRISEALKLLKRGEVNITDIALETGFYSSQHFSTTFKKLTGYTPGEFRKRNSLSE